MQSQNFISEFFRHPGERVYHFLKKKSTLLYIYLSQKCESYLTLETFEEALNKLLPLYDPSAAKSLFFRLDKKKTGRVDAKIFTKILGDDNYS